MLFAMLGVGGVRSREGIVNVEEDVEQFGATWSGIKVIRCVLKL